MPSPMQIRSFIFLLLSFQWAHAQLSTYYIQPNFDYNLAEDHYLKEAYLGARYDLENLLNFSDLEGKQKQIAELYSTNVGLLYEDENAIEAFVHFKNKYPNSTLEKQLYYGAGMYYFQQNNVEEALIFLKKADIQGFSENRKSHYYFTLGYLEFQEENYDQAKSALQKSSDIAPYASPKNYMLGHIAYTQKNYSEAMKYFEPIKEDPIYQPLILPYLVQIHFNQGEYEKASSEGQALLQSGSYSDLQSELSKIVGESEFRLQHYQKATPYLKAFIDNNPKASLPDYYQLGYVYYVQKNYAKAVENFNQITQENSPLAQNAFYQLGNSYLQNQQKKEALSAYKSSSEMDYNPEVKENALYQYALISYDIGNPYEAAAQAIQHYLNTYPQSSHRNEMETLLVNSLLHSKNYKGALETLKTIPNKSENLLQTEQTLALLYGMELYNSDDYATAVQYFNQSISITSGTPHYYKAQYWKGASLYKLENYKDALNAYKEVEKGNTTIEEKKQLPYEMGYCYLKMENFGAAKNYFQQYLQNPNTDYKADAQLRLADSYYGNEDIDEAISTYENIEDQGDFEQDFAAFQKAKLYGYKNQLDKQIESLVHFIRTYPNSNYQDEAQYELGMAYQKNKDYLKSIVAFDQVIKSKKDTELTALSLIGKGNDYAAMKEYQRALDTSRAVTQTFKNTDYSKQAVLASKTIFIEQNDIAGYQKFAQENGINLSQEEAEELLFLEAQNFYIQQKYAQVIPSLETFITQYPNSSRLLTAQYYLGDCYYKTQKDAQAIQYLEPIAKKQNEYQEDALFALGRIYLDTENDEQAELAYEALYEITENPNYRSVCEVELMYLYDAGEQYTEAAAMAEKVINNSKNAPGTLEQAKVIIARSHIKDNPSLAQSEYKALEQAQNSSVQAEAYYYNAYFKNKEKDYQASNDVIFKLTSNLSDEQYWGAKALVLMADNYHQLKDQYQASYILEEVIKTYTDFPDVIKEAKALQNKIKS